MELRVSHAIAKVDTYSPDGGLFDLLDDLKNTYAVLIVNAEGTLIGIVTSYDTTEYFRRRAEDMMYVEDIESALKEFIRVAFNIVDDTDQQKLSEVIAEVADSDLRKRFQAALNHCLSGAFAKFMPLLAEELFQNAAVFDGGDASPTQRDVYGHSRRLSPLQRPQQSLATSQSGVLSRRASVKSSTTVRSN